jgi:hypothetical protein
MTDAEENGATQFVGGKLCARALIPILGDPLLKNAMLKNCNAHQNF